MSLVWPATIPSDFQVPGFIDKPDDQSVRSQTDIGPVKRRRRYTGIVRKISGSIRMDRAQYALLRTFWDQTCGGGSAVFTFPDPVDGADLNVAWVAPPESSGAGVDWVDVKVQLETQP